MSTFAWHYDELFFHHLKKESPSTSHNKIMMHGVRRCFFLMLALVFRGRATALPLPWLSHEDGRGHVVALGNNDSFRSKEIKVSAISGRNNILHPRPANRKSCYIPWYILHAHGQELCCYREPWRTDRVSAMHGPTHISMRACKSPPSPFAVHFTLTSRRAMKLVPVLRTSNVAPGVRTLLCHGCPCVSMEQ